MSTELRVRDPQGNLVTTYTNFTRLEYARGENKTGWMYVDFAPQAVNPDHFRLDTRLEPWRSIDGVTPYLDGESVFFVRRWGYVIDAAGVELFRVYALDAIYLLESRIVGFYSESAQASKTGAADDLMKEIVTEQLLGNNLFPSTYRSLNSWGDYFAVQADLTAAPSVTKDFAWRGVAEVLQDLAAASAQLGTYLVYDVVYVTASRVEFRTYTGQRGINHGKDSGQAVVITRERRNLEQPEFYEDHTNQITYSYAGGMGIGDQREIVSLVDQPELERSPFNWREGFQDARNSDSTAGITAEAYSILQENRVKKVLTGTIIDTPGCRDGVHFRYGDVVYAEYKGQGFDAHIDALHVTIMGGRETRVNQIRAEA
jgi:hypothetical protein